MCDKELLVGYLYDEIDTVERRTMETHLLTCADCRGELKDLRSTRTRLAAWAPPAPDLEFQVVRAPAILASRTRVLVDLAGLGPCRGGRARPVGCDGDRQRRNEIRA